MLLSCKKQGKNPFTGYPDPASIPDSIALKLELEYPKSENLLPLEAFTGMYITEFLEVKIWNDFPEDKSVCNSKINVYNGDQVIDSLNFSKIDPVGSYFGLYMYKELVYGHLILAKFGDYEGFTIFVNPNGKISSSIGGQPFLDKNAGLIFSNFYSDLNGFSVYDLAQEKEIANFQNLDKEPFGFFVMGDLYYIAMLDFQSTKIEIYRIDLLNGKLLDCDVKVADLKGHELEFLFQPAD